jgi:hypothetical protein
MKGFLDRLHLLLLAGNKMAEVEMEVICKMKAEERNTHNI